MKTAIACLLVLIQVATSVFLPALKSGNAFVEI